VRMTYSKAYSLLEGLHALQLVAGDHAVHLACRSFSVFEMLPTLEELTEAAKQGSDSPASPERGEETRVQNVLFG